MVAIVAPPRHFAIALAVVLTGCSAAAGTGDRQEGASPTTVLSNAVSLDAVSPEAVSPNAVSPTTEVPVASTAADDATPASFGEPLDSAIGIPEAVERVAPIGVSIPALGIDAASVVPVGVEADGVMEVPPADQLGWYRHGVAPGEMGSAVVAGHVVDPSGPGVFRYLADLEVGDEVTVSDAAGEVRRFVVAEVELHDKAAVPFDEVFARSGDPQLVLVTCGGDWDADRRSYRANVVVTAVPA